MGKKIYRKGERSVEIVEKKSGIIITFFICGVQVNFHPASFLNEFERKNIFDFLNT